MAYQISERFCPLFCPRCGSMSANFEILNHHIINNHRDAMLDHKKDVFQFHITPITQTYFIAANNEIFTIQVSYKLENAYFFVMHNANAPKNEEYKYKLRFYGEDIHNPLVFPYRQIGKFDNNCRGTRLELNLDYLNKVMNLRLGEIAVKIEIQYREDIENRTKICLDLNGYSYLECPICYHVLRRPILMCEGGHSFCTNCHRDCKCCPLCQRPLVLTRNFIVEEIVDTVDRKEL